MKTSRYWRLSVRRTTLLSLPIIIAFIVGGSAPIILGESFNVFSGILWAFFIGVVDYNMLVLHIKGWMYIFRLFLLSISVAVTSIVGDLSVFDKDIQSELNTIAQNEYKIDLDKYNNQYNILTREREAKVIERNCQDPTQPKCTDVVKGRGVVYHAAVKRIDEIDQAMSALVKPDVEDKEPGVLIKLTVLHNYIGKNFAAGALFWFITIMTMLLETVPLILKSSKTR